ncbi:MAG: hypothetical protein ACTSQP_21490 [Promethearchaeota archaeon]
MNSKISKLNPDEIGLVYNSIEKYIEENHKLCGIKNIKEYSGLSKNKCKKILDYLIKKNKIVIVYHSLGETTIYMPKYMFEHILHLQHKPEWLKKYVFEEKNDILKKIKELKKDFDQFEIIERLLYGTGKQLEESVFHCLKLLDLKDVKLLEDPNKHDISFLNGKVKHILEVKGLEKQGKKEHITQLNSWIQQELETIQNPDNLKGVFVVNHFRNEDPDTRGDPLTNEAKKFLKYYKFKFFTTIFLFNLIKDVMQNKLTKEKARTKIIEGEKYE